MKKDKAKPNKEKEKILRTILYYHYILINAGPGTGKTFLLNLIAKLLGINVNVLLITFMNSTLRVFKETASNNDILLDDIQYKTFHSLALDILYNNSGLKINSPEPVLTNLSLKVHDEIQVLDDELEKSLLKEVTSEYSLEEKLKTFLDYYNKNLLHCKRVERGNFNLIDESTKRNVSPTKIIKKFQRKKYKEGKYHFNDIVMLASALLKDNSNIAKKYAKKYPVIIVDEFQDLNCYMFSMLVALGKAGSKLIVCGDEWQNVMNFQGSFHEIFDSFRNKFSGKSFKEYNLNKSRRLGENHVAVANHFPNLLKPKSKTRNKSNRKLKSIKKDQRPAIVKRNSYSQINEYVVNEISNILENEANPSSTIGVLYKTTKITRNKNNKINNDLFILKACLKNKGIEFIQVPFQPSDMKEVREFMKLLKFVTYPNSNVYFREALTLINNIGEVKAGRIVKNGIESIKEKRQRKIVKGYVRACKSIKNDSFNSIVNESVTLFKKYLPDDISLPPKFNLFIDWLSGLQSLEEILSNWEKDFCRYYLSKNDKRVVLSTIHSAKGSEFDYVFLLNPTDKDFTDKGVVSSIEDKEKTELCILFVALTRAKKRTIITCPRTASESRYIKTLCEAGLIN